MELIFLTASSLSNAVVKRRQNKKKEDLGAFLRDTMMENKFTSGLKNLEIKTVVNSSSGLYDFHIDQLILFPAKNIFHSFAEHKSTAELFNTFFRQHSSDEEEKKYGEKIFSVCGLQMIMVNCIYFCCIAPWPF